MKLSDLRRNFGKYELDETSTPDFPISLLKTWIEEAKNNGVKEFNGMVLSTVGKHSRPSSRIVLLKEIMESGAMVFYTNYLSKKGSDIKENPFAALHFFWPELERQIRIEGRIDKTSSEKSDVYFNSRPVESRASAMASNQSEKIENLTELKKRCQYLVENPHEIKRPKNWGGYELTPDLFEFWQGGKHRLHDRIRYCINGNQWIKERLAP